MKSQNRNEPPKGNEKKSDASYRDCRRGKSEWEDFSSVALGENRTKPPSNARKRDLMASYLRDD